MAGLEPRELCVFGNDLGRVSALRRGVGEGKTGGSTVD